MKLGEGAFPDGPIGMVAPRSKWIQIEEKETGKYIKVDTEGCPYVLLWSKPGVPGYLCIEPWSGWAGAGKELAGRPGTAVLKPGESKTCTLKAI